MLFALLFAGVAARAADPVPAAPAAPAGTNAVSQTNTTALGALKSVVNGVISEMKGETPEEKEHPNMLRLLQGPAMENFYTWIEGAGTFVDPKGVFTIKDGILHITGEKLGYLATRHEYSDYRLVAEFKWGTQQFQLTSKKKGRNSGLIVNAVGEDKEWMKGIECQLAEDRTGNVVLHSGAKLSVGVNSYAKPWTELGQPKQELEFPPGKWNTLEVISVGSRLQVLVNGKATIDALNVMPNRGKIVLQSNGAEIFFRRLDIYPMANIETSSAGKPYQWQTVTNEIKVVK